MKYNMRFFMKNIVIATNNQGKIKEFKKIFSNYNILSLKDINYKKEIIENGNTFEENAIIKAKTVSLATNQIVIADDSGLEVFALNNMPGIYSARYAEEHNDLKNNELLIKNMELIEDRRAQFVCVICIYFPNGKYYTSKGICSGIITKEPKGSNGFGYDPYFYVSEFDKTMAELTLDEKNSISHRFKAIKNLKGIIDENFSN